MKVLDPALLMKACHHMPSQKMKKNGMALVFVSGQKSNTIGKHFALGNKNCRFVGGIRNEGFSVKQNLRQRKCLEMLKILFLSLLIMIIFCSLVDSCCSNRRKLSEDSKRKLEKLLNRKKLKTNDRFVRRFCERPPRPPSTGSGTCCKYPISICSFVGELKFFLRNNSCKT